MKSWICGVPVRTNRKTMLCPNGGIRGEFAVFIQASPWYGDDVQCTNCGDKWAEGELYPRPFRRGWRKEAIARAVAAWACDCEVRRDWSEEGGGYLIPCPHQERESGCVPIEEWTP